MVNVGEHALNKLFDLRSAQKKGGYLDLRGFLKLHISLLTVHKSNAGRQCVVYSQSSVAPQLWKEREMREAGKKPHRWSEDRMKGVIVERRKLKEAGNFYFNEILARTLNVKSQRQTGDKQQAVVRKIKMPSQSSSMQRQGGFQTVKSRPLKVRYL